MAGSSYRRLRYLERWGLSAYSDFTFERALPEGALRESCMRENREADRNRIGAPAWHGRHLSRKRDKDCHERCYLQ